MIVLSAISVLVMIYILSDILWGWLPTSRRFRTSGRFCRRCCALVAGPCKAVLESDPW